MTARRIQDNSIKGLILFSLFVALSLKSLIVGAQSSRDILDGVISKKVKAWHDSVRKLRSKKSPTYLGGELSLSFPQYNLKSQIAELAGLHVSYIGTNLGGMVGSPIGKLKANVGMYYSNPSVPYTIDMMQGSLAASVYVLRLKKVKYHSFEPYAGVGFTYQGTKFYGNYLPFTDNGISTQTTNYSVTDPPLLGKTGFALLNLTTGVEYQLESTCNLFIHLFAEVNYGVAVSSAASNHSFSGTAPASPASVSVGINFGILK
jgi:hypothetical protein